MKIDFKAINESADLVELIGRHVKLTKRGSIYKGLCPFHQDDKPSLEVVPNKQLWNCPACSAGTSAIDFVMQYNNVSSFDAAKILSEGDDLSPDIQKHAPKVQIADWEHVHTLPADIAPPLFEHYKYGKPSNIWRYTDTFYTVRFDHDKGKDVLPFTLNKLHDRVEWRWKGCPKPRPLYNLDRLKSEPTKSVIVVEGEKTADALQEVMPSFIVTTWVGGANGVSNCDFDILIGRKIIYWPDHDWQGHAAMHQIFDIVGGDSKWIGAPKAAALHWDFADVDWDAVETKAFILANKNLFNSWTKPEEWVKDADRAMHFEVKGKAGALRLNGDRVSIYPRPPAPVTKPTLPAPTPKPEPKKTHKHFQHLGYGMNMSGNAEHFIYDHRAKKVHVFSPSKMSQNYFLQIAPLNYWEDRYPNKNGVDWNAAADSFTDASFRQGLYNNDKIRGRGAWMDQKRIVIHAGSHLIMDGNTVNTDELESKFIYQIDHPTGFEVGSPLLSRDSKRLIDALKLVSWQRPVNAYLLAGWLVLAPIGGLLDWRPHVWVTGPKGAGKTWIKREIIDRILGEAIVNAIGETTEAGLRQTLSSDALPVVFDEIDSDSKKDNDRIEQIMTLMRIASSESGAKVYKGTTAHQSRSFNIRSCFCFLSIVYQAARAADLSRITLLTVQEDKSAKQQDNFIELQDIVADELTETWVKGFRARTLSLLPVIIENIKVFEKAGRVILQSSRARDQVAPLAAAAWSLHSDKVITQKDAERWLSAHDWEDEKHSEEVSDESLCLDKILQHPVRVEIGEFAKVVERTIGELMYNTTGGQLDEQNSIDRLARFGIIIEGKTFTISNTAEGVKTALINTPWAKSHAKVLSRLEGATKREPCYFGHGHQSRGVVLSMKGIIFNQ